MVQAVKADGAAKKLTRRGEATRRRLVEAARVVFERDGFTGARITDIADEAQVAHGSFYTYFSSKEEIFADVIDSVLADTSSTTHGGAIVSRDPVEAIRRSNRDYYEAYRRNYMILTILDEVAGFRPEFHKRSQALREEFVERYAKSLSLLQEQGLVDADLDPRHAAGALGAMVSESMRWWLGRGEAHDPEVGIETLNKLWIRGIGLRTSTVDES